MTDNNDLDKRKQLSLLKKKASEEITQIFKRYKDYSDEDLIEALAEREAEQISLLEAQRDRDPLTGLLNKKGLEIAFNTTKNNLLRQKSEEQVSLLWITGSRTLNEDETEQEKMQIIHMGLSIIMAARRLTDIISRYSGDQFVVVLPYTNTEGAQKLAADIQSAYQNFQRGGTLDIKVITGTTKDELATLINRANPQSPEQSTF